MKQRIVIVRPRNAGHQPCLEVQEYDKRLKQQDRNPWISVGTARYIAMDDLLRDFPRAKVRSKAVQEVINREGLG